MNVRKRNGALEPLDLSKILRAITRAATGITHVDPSRVAVKTIGSIHDGVTTNELDLRSIDTAVSLIPEHKNYSALAAALLLEVIRKEVAGQGIVSFSQSFAVIHALHPATTPGAALVEANQRKLDNAIDDKRNAHFGYFGLKNVYDHLLVRNPETGKVLETPQQMFMRLSVAGSNSSHRAIKRYRELAEMGCIPDAPLPPSTLAPASEDAELFVRDLMPGMGQAVAERTVLRKDAQGRWETWGDVAHRVALGNALLASTPEHTSDSEHRLLRRHIAKGNTLMSGRHLQHGDALQSTRNMEVFTNCLDGSTRILTMEYGPIEIDRIDGETVHVIAADGVPRPALIQAHGEQEVFEMVFRQNSAAGNFRRDVLATANHRWFLRTGEVTESLRVGDVLKSVQMETERDPHAVIHGLIFGDGSAHKSRNDIYRRGVSQGRTYASIRVCKQDEVRDTIHSLLDEAGYRYTQPPHAQGDRVYYIGKLPHAKELPFSNDPQYIAGFLYGWWLADGSKTCNHALEITTASEEAAAWLEEHAAFAGYNVTMHRRQARKPGDGSYTNGRDLHTLRVRPGVEWKVDRITSVGVRPVFCPEEPVTSGFVLANGLLTGNCSTAAASFLEFYLLLNGSGVGRAYDDDMMLADWDYAPNLRCVLDSAHPDFVWGSTDSLRDARHKYGAPEGMAWFNVPPFGAEFAQWKEAAEVWQASDAASGHRVGSPRSQEDRVIWFQVPDSREGWAKALELWEVLTFEKVHQDKTLILDFSLVRPKGMPIGGMQNRPASGPQPLMNAFLQAASLKGAGLARWKQTIYLDHYFAECVLVGGARRAARMATKSWRDKQVLDFITVKRPIEYLGLSAATIEQIRKERAQQGAFQFMGFLWSSNNSITVDQEFWDLVRSRTPEADQTDLEKHAKAVFELASAAAYGDGTGEPGFINVDRLVQIDKGFTDLLKGEFVQSAKYKLNEDTHLLMSKLAKRAKVKQYNMIVNPCVTADTWIQTVQGPRQVHELVGHPFQVVVNGKPYAATGFWETGTKPVFKLKTDRGYSLRLTGNHKLLVERERRLKLNGEYNIVTDWVAVEELQIGDKLVLNNNSAYQRPLDDKSEDFERGWLLGLLVGDGGHHPEKYPSYVRFWVDPSDEAERDRLAQKAQDIVRKLPFDKHRPSPMGESHPQPNPIHGTVTIRSRAIDEFAAQFVTPGAKAILPALERGSDDLVAGFLRGFFDADGSVQGSIEKGVSVRLGQSDIGRLEVVQRMLMRFSIASTLYLYRRDEQIRLLPDRDREPAEYKVSAQHELVISRDNVVRFQQIGFEVTAKAERLVEVLANRKRAYYKDRFLARVDEIAPDGEEPVYDCTVDEVHCFDANGITAHNCGEIPLMLLGAFCVIADIVPFHADTLDEAEECFRATTRALMRVNTMDSIYSREVRRTNRIGPGLTGVHEFAWKFFGYGFLDLIDEEKSKDFWLTLARFNRAIHDEAVQYAAELGVEVPHTMTTIKPAGTTSKLFGLTEGWHLPAMAYWLRWVQFRSDDPLIEQYKNNGYPVRELKTYSGTTIVGFPTAPTIAALGMGDKLVTAGQATPEQQYQWLKLGEKYWIAGTDEAGVPVTENYGGQISYTLKYKPSLVSYEHFRDMLLEHQSEVRCCSVMPQEEASAYEYLPEEPITEEQYYAIKAALVQDVLKKADVQEEIGREHVDCANGICPVDFNAGNK